MYKSNKEHKIKIISYCIMNNHAHMLIETEKISELSKYMQRLNTKYAMYYNKKYNRVGYVFRDRYKAEGIYSEEQLYNCIRYIYNNPVKAGICFKAEDYPYSNYKIVDKEVNDDQKACEEIIQEFLIKKGIEINELKKDKETLKELIILLKTGHNISLRKISEEIRMGRETIRKIYTE